jgi:CheY-like chemotaxis protein
VSGSSANRQRPGIPIIQITGAWISNAARERGLASGADAYLIEPVDDATLIKSVVSLIETAT